MSKPPFTFPLLLAAYVYVSVSTGVPITEKQCLGLCPLHGAQIKISS